MYVRSTDGIIAHKMHHAICVCMSVSCSVCMYVGSYVQTYHVQMCDAKLCMHAVSVRARVYVHVYVNVTCTHTHTLMQGPFSVMCWICHAMDVWMYACTYVAYVYM
jgi:hypothetical protein